MTRHLVTFVNYNNDYNSKEDKERYALFKQFNSERNKLYCQKHNIVYHEVDETVFKIPLMFKLDDRPEFEVKNNNHFARWQYIRDKIDDSTFKEGDIICYNNNVLFKFKYNS